MKNQIETITKLMPLLKNEAQKEFFPSCGWEDVTENIRIYFDNGYDVFAFKIRKARKHISVREYSQAIDMPLDTTEKDLEQAITYIEEAIEYLKSKTLRKKHVEIEAKRAKLLKQLEDLNNA
jgi:hypothetical protein